ncbi:hypothetical protein RQP46_002124 [Phenoliferia psychrophenolica]
MQQTADWPRHKAHCKALAAQSKMQQESLKSFPKGIHRDAGQRIEQWIRLGMTELECAITSAEHCLLTPPESLSTSHTFSVIIDYHPEVEDDSLCFTIKQINLMPNDVVSELMERPVEDRQAMADLAMKTGKVHNSRFVHAFFIFGDDGMYFLPFPIQADRKAERQLGKVCGAPDWWKDENWEENLLRRLRNSAFAKEGKGMPERFPTHLKDCYGAPQGPPPGQYGFPEPQGFPQPGQYQPAYNPQQAPTPAQPPRGYQAPTGPPPMHYGAPQGAPPPQNFGPPQYQGGQFQAHMQPPQGQQFQYSNCTGKRKALVIGINYTGSANALAGCHNDAKNMAKFLCDRYNYKQEDIVMLMDTPRANPMEVPTKANIIRGMQWLVRDARPNDALFFHYSGHGGQTEDLDGDEDDGYDETIYPLDFKNAGQIVDDQMHEILVRPLPMGCRLTAIFDSCHSGSALDLPYIYSTQGKLKEPNLLADAGQSVLGAAKDYMRGDVGGALSSLMSFGKKAMGSGGSNQQQVRAAKMSNADCISWSGCKDTQTSADTSEAGKATGAMSFAFIAALTKYPQQTYMQLLNTIRDELKGRYDQKPQLSCSHELDCNLLAIF